MLTYRRRICEDASMNELEQLLENVGRLNGRTVAKVEKLGALSVRVHFTDGSYQPLVGLLAVLATKDFHETKQ